MVRNSKLPVIAGFTLIEVLVVAAIISLGFSFLLNLRSRAFLNETVNLVVADIRNVQFKALSSARYGGNIRCGYGIHDDYSDYNSYFVYTSDDVPAGTDCGSGEDRRYCTEAPGSQNENDEKVAPDERLLFHPSLEFKSGANDSNFGPVFFEPPYPTTFLCTRRNNMNCPSGVACDLSHTDPSLSPTAITIGSVNRTCAQAPCKTICVYASGRIEVINGEESDCPPPI